MKVEEATTEEKPIAVEKAAAAEQEAIAAKKIEEAKKEDIKVVKSKGEVVKAVAESETKKGEL